MSLNQKYTWNDFLKNHPEHKQKKTKRTSKEGQKAFESAAKTHLKEYLKDRLAKIDATKEETVKKRKDLSAKLKNAKSPDRAKNLQNRIGSADSYLARLERNRDRTKSTQKSL